MTDKKKAVVKKKVSKKKVLAGKSSRHPLMLNNQSWDKEAVMSFICEQIAISNKPITKILEAGYKNGRLPDLSTLYSWMNSSEILDQMYARAKMDQADFLVDEMLTIADNAEQDLLDIPEDADKGQARNIRMQNTVAVQRAKLQIDTRKWIASKLKPKKYSDKIEAAGGFSLTVNVDRGTGEVIVDGEVVDTNE